MNIRLDTAVGLLLSCWSLVMLAGCVDAVPEAQVSRGDVRNAIARGTMVSPRPATVAMASLEGPPPAEAARFSAIFARQAADREITMGDATLARYLVRGYLSVYPAEQGGAQVSYVYDIFDKTAGRRIDRVADVMSVPGTGPDAWASIDDQVMASLAGRSADDLAVALAGMPEAQAARTVTAATTAQTPN